MIKIYVFNTEDDICKNTNNFMNTVKYIKLYNIKTCYFKKNIFKQLNYIYNIFIQQKLFKNYKLNYKNYTFGIQRYNLLTENKKMIKFIIDKKIIKNNKIILISLEMIINLKNNSYKKELYIFEDVEKDNIKFYINDINIIFLFIYYNLNNILNSFLLKLI